MQSEGSIGSPTRALGVLLLVARWTMAILLGVGALVFLLHGRADFARLGRPDGARIALGCAEMAGAGLLLFARTVRAGSLLLLIVLAWAAGFHFAVGLSSGVLWIFLLAVLAILAATRARKAQEVP
jgi:hypothetical protein